MVILLVALIVLGPSRLPEAGRQVGKALAEVRKWSQGFQDEIKNVMEPQDTSRPSYSQPQPGYDPPPIPMVPAETPPPPELSTTAPAEANGTGNDTTGSHGETTTASPADWTPWDRPAAAPAPAPAADPVPPDAPGPPAVEPPAS